MNEIDTQFDMLIQFMNQTRSKYMGMDITYEMDEKDSNTGLRPINLYLEGEFPLPIITKSMFEDLFESFFMKDSPYFNIPKILNKTFYIRNVILNGKKIGNNLTLSDKLKNNIQDYYNNITKYFKVTLPLNSTVKTLLLEGYNSKIDYYFELEDNDFARYDVIIKNPELLKLNGNPFTRKTINDFMESVEGLPTERVSPDYIFELISNLLTEESRDRQLNIDGEMFSSFYDMLYDSGMDYNNALTENLSVFIQTSLVSYDGLNNLNYGEYLEDDDFEVLDMFINWLETNKGKYEL